MVGNGIAIIANSKPTLPVSPYAIPYTRLDASALLGRPVSQLRVSGDRCGDHICLGKTYLSYFETCLGGNEDEPLPLRSQS